MVRDQSNSLVPEPGGDGRQEFLDSGMNAVSGFAPLSPAIEGERAGAARPSPRDWLQASNVSVAMTETLKRLPL